MEPLDPLSLLTVCDPTALDFETTAELAPLEEVLGQERALGALRFAVGMTATGYNVFAFGEPGAGRHTLVRKVLDAHAVTCPAPRDWCYVEGFDDSHRPRALGLPAGRGAELKRRLEQLVRDLHTAIPQVLESDEYRARLMEIESALEERHGEVLKELQSEADQRGLTLVRTPVGFAFAPTRDGQVVPPDDFAKLPKEERKKVNDDIEAMQERLQAVIAQVPAWRKETREKIRALSEELVALEVGAVVGAIEQDFAELGDVVEWLEALETDIVGHADLFKEDEPKGPLGGNGSPSEKAAMRRYAVNLLVDNTGCEGAPVVTEDIPTLANLLGRVEHISQFGALLTDHNLIKPGALHRANGGYLVLDARRVLTEPYAWDSLKRVLRAGEIRIESLSERLSLLSTVTLQPEPIPLEVKIVLVGEPLIYYLLCALDPEFSRHFKVAADFDDRMPRDADSTTAFARLIATVIAQRELRAFDRAAVARVIEQAARDAGDGQRLSMDVERLGELLAEAEYQARRGERDVVTADDVQAAIDAQLHRASRPRDRVYEAIEDGLLHVDTAGEIVGQINGLAVLQLGDFRFGRPTRITATARLGRGEVVDIEREAKLGGELHSKGVLILSSFLAHRFAGDDPLSLSASLVFEQSYGPIDGDSASLAELLALLSAIADVPLRQWIAVTGSVDQHGRVQAIGGVNEKIEGFYDVTSGREGGPPCRAVAIPAANKPHLMLRRDIVAAAERDAFRVWAVETVDQAIELLTGMPAGERGPDGTWSEGTFNRRVADRLAALTERRQELGQAMNAAGQARDER